MQQKKDYSQLLQRRQFNPLLDIEEDKIYLSILGNTIGTQGNFIALTGLPKAGKSTFVSAIISAAITGNEQLGIKAHTYENNFRICLIDTEQSAFDFNRTVKRVEKFTNYDRIGVFKFFDAFLFSGDSANDILNAINEYLKAAQNLSILIIDGILDLIDNMNDEGASKRLIRTLKRWARKYGILIITVLHLGKKDQNSIGHIGSASDRYAQSTLTIEKNKIGNFEIKPKFLRSAKDFDTIEITYSTNMQNYVRI
jgi:Cdc6-like AAA superfamily ATPase